MTSFEVLKAQHKELKARISRQQALVNDLYSRLNFLMSRKLPPNVDPNVRMIRKQQVNVMKRAVIKPAAELARLKRIDADIKAQINRLKKKRRLNLF